MDLATYSTNLKLTQLPQELITEVQQCLSDGGYKVTINGIADAATRQAFSDFKKASYLQDPEYLGPSTATALLKLKKNRTASQLVPGLNYLRLTRTPEKDQFGCQVLKLQYFKDGQVIDEINMRSGQPSKQYFRKGVDSISGSGEPLPEGRWRIENLFWAGGKDNWMASHGEGIGPVSVPLTYDGPGMTGRSEIVIHNDHNANQGKSGSVGCPVTYNLNDMKKVVTWLRDTDPRYLYVDWNLGSCPSVYAVLQVSNKLPRPGVELIKKFESCFLNAYPDPLSGNEPITIGWGCTLKEDGSKWQLGDRITQERADKLLIDQLSNRYVSDLEQSVPFWEQMNENQKGALLSFGYNLGSKFMTEGDFDSIRRILKNKQWAELPETLSLYRNPGTHVELGLKRRRFAEGLVWQGVSVEEAYLKAMAIAQKGDRVPVAIRRR
ncbi:MULTISPECIES: lysozyme [Nostocales]|uniref:Lysozyme n=4 Tax=Nostocales TaxID=1161 RepID=A0A8S9TAR5_9CYAN|nr:lysozyme [Tolypothrix bouteillei]KAF3889495.1 muraminidase [Tolypothrix bouteillei VB521301]